MKTKEQIYNSAETLKICVETGTKKLPKGTTYKMLITVQTENPFPVQKHKEGN